MRDWHAPNGARTALTTSSKPPPCRAPGKVTPGLHPVELCRNRNPAAQALAKRHRLVKALLSSRRLPDKGWDEGTIEMLIRVRRFRFSLLDAALLDLPSFWPCARRKCLWGAAPPCRTLPARYGRPHTPCMANHATHLHCSPSTVRSAAHNGRQMCAICPMDPFTAGLLRDGLE